MLVLPTNNPLGRRKGRPVNLHGICFGPDLQMEKGMDDVTSSIINLIQKWAEAMLSLKCRSEVVNTYISNNIWRPDWGDLHHFTFDLTLPHSVKRIHSTDEALPRFAISAEWEIKMPRLLLCRYALRLRHLQVFLGSCHVSSHFVRPPLQQLVFLT